MMETYANNLEAIVDDRTRQVIGKIFEIISIKIIIIVIVSTKMTIIYDITNYSKSHW